MEDVRQAEEEVVRLLAEAKAPADAEAKAAADAASSSQAKGIFIQLPDLDAISEKVDTVAAAQVKLVNEVNAVKTSTISAVHNTVLSYKPDLSSISHEVRSLIQVQDAKIEAQVANG